MSKGTMTDEEFKRLWDEMPSHPNWGPLRDDYKRAREELKRVEAERDEAIREARIADDDKEDYAKERDAAIIAKQKAEAELRFIDERLARRPALDALQSRADKVERACSVAGKADAALAEVALLMDAMDTAWGVIANAGKGDWDSEGVEWKAAAERWRDRYWHPALKRNLPLAATEPKR